MTNQNINKASRYFNANWQRYRDGIDKNLLHHDEMMSTLSEFLDQYFPLAPFTMVDLGCGDSYAIAPALSGKLIDKYIGIDAAGDILKLAPASLSHIACEKEFICDDIIKAVSSLKKPVDIIFSSYAIHHFSLAQKSELLQACQDKLTENGLLLIVDVVLDAKQTHEAWLDALRERFKLTDPDMSLEELNARMQHPRESDQPEHISTYAEIAEYQGWRDFEILLDKGIFAFMAFFK